MLQAIKERMEKEAAENEKKIGHHQFTEKLKNNDQHFQDIIAEGLVSFSKWFILIAS